MKRSTKKLTIPQIHPLFQIHLSSHNPPWNKIYQPYHSSWLGSKIYPHQYSALCSLTERQYCPQLCCSGVRAIRSFLEQLSALPNQSLWKNLQLEGHGSLIYRLRHVIDLPNKLAHVANLFRLFEYFFAVHPEGDLVSLMVQKPVTCGYGFHSAAAHEAAKEMDPTKQVDMKRLFSGHQLAILESRVNYRSDEDMLKHGVYWEG
jgi:hypothetical protein